MKQYLGDSVYVEFKNDIMVLTTEYGAEITNIIHLEHDVLIALNLFIATVKNSGT